MANETTNEALAWLRKADDDLRGAEVDLKADPPLVADALFHCQQAAEKATKAFLTAHDLPFRKTHDLDELALACEGIDPTLCETLGPVRDLTVFAWEFRYPGSDETPNVPEANAYLLLARKAVDTIRGRLTEMTDGENGEAGVEDGPVTL